MTDRRPDFHTAFSNQTSCVALACSLLIENADTSGGDYRFRMDVGEQIIALLIMVRDASEAKLAGADQ